MSETKTPRIFTNSNSSNGWMFSAAQPLAEQQKTSTHQVREIRGAFVFE
jgi:hypothetical protein